MNILIVIGTRPNFIKVTQFKKLASNYSSIDLKIVHTGQHYDDKMADVFFKQFNLTPDYFLNISQGSPNAQIAEIMQKLEQLILKDFKPDLLIVVGDVNSTLAATITANKMGIKLAHIESGLRSFDETMPEEHNRIITDKLSNLFFVTEQSGYDNLIKEGITGDKIVFVGNTMIDTIVAFEKDIDRSNILNQYALSKKLYELVMLLSFVLLLLFWHLPTLCLFLFLQYLLESFLLLYWVPYHLGEKSNNKQETQQGDVVYMN